MLGQNTKEKGHNSNLHTLLCCQLPVSFHREQTYSILSMWELYVQIFAWLSLKFLSLLSALNCENDQGKGEKDSLLVTSRAQSCVFSEKEVFNCCFLADGG